MILSETKSGTVNITLPVPPETQAELERRAAEAGVDVATFVLEALNETLDDRNAAIGDALTFDQWHAEFRAWVGRQSPRNPHFDDSRDSIYN